MIKQAMSEAGLAPLAVMGLVAFVVVFLGVALWAMTRGRRQVVGWSSLPLEDGARLPVINAGGTADELSIDARRRGMLSCNDMQPAQ